MPLPRRTRLRPALGALLAAACLTGAVTGPADAGSGSADRDHDRTLQKQLEALVRSPGGPPGVIAVLRREGTSRVVRAGVADLDSGRPIETDDHTRIASTAKAFSGAVALRLVDRHALSLDDTIGRRLPSLPRQWSAVTLRQLLNHTSGLPDYSRSPGFVEILTADPRHHFDSRRLLDFVAGEPLLFPPGSRYQYSNSDNIAIALMAEAATGVRYERLLRELVHRPLGLRDTSLPQDYEMPEPYMHGCRIFAQCSTLQGGGEGHPAHGGPEGRSGMAGSPCRTTELPGLPPDGREVRPAEAT
ncbi:beta-lactamase family protein [Streptomyces triticiradicis]|uniref:Beta-lactamase family protein n=1 Tax=Streptomyces triticiradicis TaxID=2651189 RepID=A0A7J5DEJ0_9ACTN|nr:beta-lactamase family protein [Streptomyces triticiradicis]